MLVQPFVANCSIVAFDVGVLTRIAGLNISQRYLPYFSPCFEVPTNVLRAVVEAYHFRLAAPFDDWVEHSRDAIR